MINITFPDGSVRRFEDGVNAYAVAESIRPRLRKATLAAELNGELYDEALPIHGDCTLKLLTFAGEEKDSWSRPRLHRKPVCAATMERFISSLRIC